MMVLYRSQIFIMKVKKFKIQNFEPILAYGHDLA
jgi:hypothetical protein